MHGKFICAFLVILASAYTCAACPYLDALTLFQGQTEKAAQYVRSLRGLMGAQELHLSTEVVPEVGPPSGQGSPGGNGGGGNGGGGNGGGSNGGGGHGGGGNGGGGGNSGGSVASPTRSPTSSPAAGPSTASAPFCIKTNGLAALTTNENICTSFKSIAADIVAALPSDQAGLANFYGKALRLAFHDAGEVDLTKADLMGPDGCLSATAANAGLTETNSLVATVFEGIWQRHCDAISRADFWALLAKIVVERADPTHTIRIAYQYGRRDNAQCSAGANRLPSAQQGSSMLQQVFVTQMGLTLNDAVTLIGAHTLGHVHTGASGYGVALSSPPKLDDNAWDSTPAAFDNKYYQSLVSLPAWNTAFPNGAGKNLWTRGGNKEIMLNADMAVGFDITIDSAGLASRTQRCGSQSAPGQKYGCVNPTASAVPATAALAKTFAADNAAFLSAFAESFSKMTTVGYGAQGKLGTLADVDLTTC